MPFTNIVIFSVPLPHSCRKQIPVYPSSPGEDVACSLRTSPVPMGRGSGSFLCRLSAHCPGQVWHSRSCRSANAPLRPLCSTLPVPVRWGLWNECASDKSPEDSLAACRAFHCQAGLVGPLFLYYFVLIDDGFCLKSLLEKKFEKLKFPCSMTLLLLSCLFCSWWEKTHLSVKGQSDCFYFNSSTV